MAYQIKDEICASLYELANIEDASNNNEKLIDIISKIELYGDKREQISDDRYKKMQAKCDGKIDKLEHRINDIYRDIIEEQ